MSNELMTVAEHGDLLLLAMKSKAVWRRRKRFNRLIVNYYKALERIKELERRVTNKLLNREEVRDD